MVNVRVRDDCQWSTVWVGGKAFTRHGEVMQEAHLTDEMRRSPLLAIQEVAQAETVAEPAAEEPRPRRRKGVEDASG